MLSKVPPMSPGIGGWGGEYWPHHAHPHPLAHDRYADQLVDSMGEGLKLGPDSWGGPARPPNPQDCMKMSQLSPHGPPTSHMNGYVTHHHHNHHPQVRPPSGRNHNHYSRVAFRCPRRAEVSGACEGFGDLIGILF